MTDTIAQEVTVNTECSEASDQVIDLGEEDISQPEDPIPKKSNSFLTPRKVLDAMFQENFANYSPGNLAAFERRFEEQNSEQLHHLSSMDLAELPEFLESRDIETQTADTNGPVTRPTFGSETPTGRPRPSRSGMHPPVIKYYMNSLTKKLTSLQKNHEDRMQAASGKEPMDEQDVPEPGTVVHVQHNLPNPLLGDDLPQPDGNNQQMTIVMQDVDLPDQQQCISQFRDLLRMPEGSLANQLPPLQGMSSDISQDEVAEAAAFLQRMDPGFSDYFGTQMVSLLNRQANTVYDTSSSQIGVPPSENIQTPLYSWGSDPYSHQAYTDRSSMQDLVPQVPPQPCISSTPYGSQRSESGENLYPSPCGDLNYLTPISKVGQRSMELQFDSVPSSGWETSSSSHASSSVPETPSRPISAMLLNSSGSAEMASSSQESTEGSGSISDDYSCSQNPLLRPPPVHLKLPTASQLNDAVFKRVQICIDSNDNREMNKSKERLRRTRMKDACEKLRRILPASTTQKADKASMLERAASYISFLQSCLGTSMQQLNQDYLVNYE